MVVSDKHAAIANELRKIIQRRTKTVSDGEGVAMFLLWGFLMDHALVEGMDIETLAREQMEAFIEYARNNVHLAREH